MDCTNNIQGTHSYETPVEPLDKKRQNPQDPYTTALSLIFFVSQPAPYIDQSLVTLLYEENE